MTFAEKQKREWEYFLNDMDNGQQRTLDTLQKCYIV